MSFPIRDWKFSWRNMFPLCFSPHTGPINIIDDVHRDVSAEHDETALNLTDAHSFLLSFISSPL